tara:strand:+ start:232 stop:438 length:207 start_codon:yes stop_codon:yes gene_type:complete
MKEQWRKDRDLAGAKLIEMWSKGNFDQPLYLVYIDLGDYDFSYHIITKTDFNSSYWHDAKFVTSIGEK